MKKNTIKLGGKKSPSVSGVSIPPGIIFKATSISYHSSGETEHNSLFFKTNSGYVYDLADPSRSWWDNANELTWHGYEPVTVTIEVNE